VSLVAGRSGGNSEQKKKAFSSIFTTDTKSFIHVTRIAAMHIIFYNRYKIVVYTGMRSDSIKNHASDTGMDDVKKQRNAEYAKHLNDPVLSSLRMEGTRLLFF
jgi:hypothetical protein